MESNIDECSRFGAGCVLREFNMIIVSQIGLNRNIFFSQGFFHFSLNIINNGFSKYLNDVQHTSIEMDSFYNSIPRLVNMFLSTFVGFFSDWMVVRWNIRLTIVRKLFAALCKNGN